MVPRLAVYGVISTGLAVAVVGSALKSRPNFFASAVSIGRSSGALMVLANFAIFNSVVFGIVFKSIFFGRLRAVEYEHLFERLWLFLTESLLALTIFRDDFSAPFAFMYGVLLFLKCFHWITADRVDYMDQIPPPGPPTLFHIRMASIISLLTLLDILLVTYSLESILVDGVSAMVLFASEFMILFASILGTSARYFVGLVDLRRARGREDAPSWEEKSMYLFYVDLSVDFVKLLTYLTFFTVILLHYGLPLHILRDVYTTMRSFLNRCGDLIRYRRATRDMDALYPNATPEEMERLGDRTCIICREEMNASVPGQPADAGTQVGQGPNETPKKLACGHVFHFHCLRSWLERQQSCPTCRRNVLDNSMNRQANARNPIIPPPPVPGAAPHLNGNAPGQPRPQLPHQAIQAAYNEFFQIPNQFNNPIPPALAARHPANGPTDGPRNSTANPANGVGNEGDADQRIQQSIWGGPVVPGRFFPTPLGAAPQWPTQTSIPGSSHIHIRPSLASPRIRSVTEPTPVLTATRPSPEPIVEDTPTPNSPVQERSGLHTRDGTSGVTTPFTSNPPEIFSATSTSRAIEAELPDGTEDVLDITAARRAAAEAAMRRMGMTGSSSDTVADPTLASTSSSNPVEGYEVRNGTEPPASSSKGKMKESVDLNHQSSQPRYTPFLTPVQFPLGGTASSSSIRKPWVGSHRPTIQGVKTSLDERLRVLTEVDGVIWEMVGELSRLKSVWEAEDGDGEGARVREGVE